MPPSRRSRRSTSPSPPDAVQQLIAAIPKPQGRGRQPPSRPEVPPPPYKLGDSVATREAYGTALARLGALDPRIVALDADVGNSTFSEKFEKQFPDRFYQMYIAEQVMVGAAHGACRARRDSVPVHVRLLPHARVRLHPHGGDQQPEHQAGGLACGRLDRRGRPLADGARGPRDDARRAEHDGALPVRGGERRAARRTGGVSSGPGVHPHEPPEDAGHSTSRRRSSTSAARRCCARAPSDTATVVAAGVTVFEALAAYDRLRPRASSSA